MMGFSIQTPPQLLFGRGMKDRAADAIAGFGPSGILVHGANGARADWLAQELRAKGLILHPIACGSEPTLAMLEAALAASRPFSPAWVTAVGGGAVLDMGKAGLGAAQGLAATDHPDAARAAMEASSMKTNPVPLTEAELLEILSQAAL